MFRVQGLGLSASRVQDFGHSAFWVQGLGFEVQASGFRAFCV